MPPLRNKEDIISQSDSGLTETGNNLAQPRRLSARLIRVSVSDIRPSPSNARNLDLTLEQLQNPSMIEDPEMRKEAAYIQDMSLTMRDHGQLQPGLGYRVGSGMIELMAGERRWLACQLADLDEMEVMVYPERPDGNAAQHLIENIHRRDLTPAGVLRGLLNIIDEREAAGQPIKSGKELKEIVRMPQTVAYRWWAVIQGEDDLRDALLRDEVPSVVVAERLSKMDQAERQRRIEAEDFDDLRESRRNRIASKEKDNPPAAQPVTQRKPGRPVTHVNMGRCDNGEVVRHLIETLDPEGSYDHVNWANLNQVGEVWRGLLRRLHERYE